MWSYSENIWPNAQRNWPNARAFDELRSHLVTVGRIDQMRSAFGQTRSAVGQMHAHLTNFFRIWSLLIGLTKCAAHLGKRAAQLAKRVRNLPNVAHLVKCRAFDQLVKCAAHLAKCADWSNAPYIIIIISSLHQLQPAISRAGDSEPY